MARYKVECPKCHTLNFFTAKKSHEPIMIKCRKCSYLFKVSLSSGQVPAGIDAIALEADALVENIIGGVLFLFLLGGSIFSPMYFISVLIAIVISIFFPPLIIFPIAVSFYVVYQVFGLFAALIYVAIAGFLAILYLYIKVFSTAESY